MQIDKNQIIDMLRSRGDDAKADQADKQLPEKVDTDQHSELLTKVGINPKDLLDGPAGLLGS